MATATTSEAARVVASNARARAQAEAAQRRADTTTPIAGQPYPPTEDLPADLPDVRFSRGAARRPVQTLADPLLQWATGLATTDRQIYAGWMTEAGKHEDLDLAMNDAGLRQVKIKHGSGNIVSHWALEIASLFVVCDGVQAMSEMRDSTERFGIAFGWRVTDDGRKQSVLRCRVFVQELCAVGYLQPLLLSVKSTLTGDLLGCLMRHYTALDMINPLREADGKPPINVPFYAVSIALGPGAEVQRGNGQTKTIVPMVDVPSWDKDYLRNHWCKRAWVEAIERIADDTIAWSVRESATIASGEAKEEWES